MLTLETPVEFTDKIRPICLPANIDETYEGEVATVAGWGWAFDPDLNIPLDTSIPRKVDMTVGSLAECKVWEDYLPQTNDTLILDETWPRSLKNKV